VHREADEAHRQRSPPLGPDDLRVEEVAEAIAASRVWSRYAPAAVGWAFAIAVSTCLTKQHFALVVLAGALLGLGADRLAMRGVPHEAVASRGTSAPPRSAPPLHYGWPGALLQLGLFLAFLGVAYVLFRLA